MHISEIDQTLLETRSFMNVADPEALTELKRREAATFIHELPIPEPIVKLELV